jgi:hypothetical protein
MRAEKLSQKFLSRKIGIGLKTKNWRKLTQKMRKKISLDAASLKTRVRILVWMCDIDHIINSSASIRV